MKHKLLLPITLFAVLTAGMTFLIGCKQSEGERCQVNDDCESGLSCNQGTEPPSCQSAGGNEQIDATVPDAEPDAPPTDAVDAMPDA